MITDVVGVEGKQEFGALQRSTEAAALSDTGNVPASSHWLMGEQMQTNTHTHTHAHILTLLLLLPPPFVLEEADEERPVLVDSVVHAALARPGVEHWVRVHLKAIERALQEICRLLRLAVDAQHLWRAEERGEVL